MDDEKDINASPDNSSPSPPDAKSKSEKKGKGKLIFFLVFLLIIGSLAAVLILDIGGFRENVIMPYLRNAPIIGGFLPAVVEEEEELTPEELLQRYTILSQQLESVQAQLALANEQTVTQEELIEHLRAFQEAWHLYREARATFEQMLALGDPENFLEYFDFVGEDNLVQLYLQAMEMAEFIEETTAIVATLNNMDESGAGEVLVNLMTTDLDLMVRALWMMTPTRRAEIFDTLEAEDVTRMIVLMSPDEPVFAPALPPELPEFPPPPFVFPEGYDITSPDFWRDLLLDAIPEELRGEMPDEYLDEFAQEMVEMVGTDEFWSFVIGDFVDLFIEEFGFVFEEEGIDAEDDETEEEEE